MDGVIPPWSTLGPALAIGAYGVLTVLRIMAICMRDERVVHDLKRRVMTMRNERIKKVLDAGGVVVARPEDEIIEV